MRARGAAGYNGRDQAKQQDEHRIVNKRTLSIVIGVVVALAVTVAVTLALVPTETNPAFATAIAFVNAAGLGDEAAAAPHMGAPLAAYAAAECPGGAISACIAALVPADWGAFRQFVFRRAEPFREGWAVDLIGYYETGVGNSGVCTSTYVVQGGDGVWRVEAMAGWIHCADPESRDMHENPAAPNRMPA
jgi:hypothetical protein